jgi:hypothetical protein
MPQDRGVGLFVFSVRSHPSDLTYKVRRDGYAIAARQRVTRLGRLQNQGAAKSVRWNIASDLAQFVCWCFES